MHEGIHAYLMLLDITMLQCAKHISSSGQNEVVQKGKKEKILCSLFQLAIQVEYLSPCADSISVKVKRNSSCGIAAGLRWTVLLSLI